MFVEPHVVLFVVVRLFVFCLLNFLLVILLLLFLLLLLLLFLGFWIWNRESLLWLVPCRTIAPGDISDAIKTRVEKATGMKAPGRC